METMHLYEGNLRNDIGKVCDMISKGFEGFRGVSGSMFRGLEIDGEGLGSMGYRFRI